MLALPRRFLATSIRISKGYSRRHTHSSDIIITGSTTITHQDHPGPSTLSFRKQSLEGKKKWGSSWNNLWEAEHLHFSESPLFLWSFSKCLNLLYYLCFYVATFPFESCGMATHGNDDSGGLSHPVQRERKAAADDHRFSRRHGSVQAAVVIN